MNARFRFEKGVNTLIGENGSGKTNAFYALRLLLDDALARNAGQMREQDFCRALGDWRGHWIVLAVDFAELDSSEGCQILRHTAAHMDASETGTCTLMFRPKKSVRRKLFELTESKAAPAEFASVLSSLTTDQYEAVTTGRAKGDFLSDDTYRAVVGDFTTHNFPDPDCEDQLVMGVRCHGIDSEVSCTFAQALRDVVSDLRGYRNNPLLALLRGTESTIRVEDAESIVSAVADLNQQISSLSEVRRVAEGVQSTLHETVGHTYSPSISVESALPDTLDRLVQRLTVKVGDQSGTAYREDLAEQSLGGANLIYLALKLLEFELKSAGERVAHFLLIEEPEAHIHTHVQRTLFEKQSARKTQVIVSTHSTHISSASKIRSVNILARGSDFAEVYQPAAGLDSSQVIRLERYLDAVRSTLLFAKGVLLVEGDAELVMLPALLGVIFGVKPDELGVSVISVGSAFFDHLSIIFDDMRVRRRCAIATDLDMAWVSLPADPLEDSVVQKRARHAQGLGAKRREKLDSYAETNKWVKAFFATHTFEVDFLLAGNADLVARAVPSAYASATAIQEATADLEGTNTSLAASRVVKIAEKIGKGWFAILLAEQLTVETAIPDYLLRSIAFAAGALQDQVIKRMALYRIKNSPPRFGTLVAEDLLSLSPDVAVTTYLTQAPDDVLSKLVTMSRDYRAS